MTTTAPAIGIPDEVFEVLDRLDVRYELLDGQLVVSPSAEFGHEKLSGLIRSQLTVHAPEGFEVLGPDYNVVYAAPEPWFICPDALVARTEDCGWDNIRVAPLLALETISRSSRRSDTGAKWDIYAKLGVPSYWLIDPVEKSLTLLRLHDGGYVETASISGDEVMSVTEPFPATISLTRQPAG